MFVSNPSSDPRGDARRSAAARDALSDVVDWAYGGVSLSRSRPVRGCANTGPRAGLCEMLSDPIVRALMAADGTDRDSVKAMMRDVAARLTQSRKLPACRDGLSTNAG